MKVIVLITFIIFLSKLTAAQSYDFDLQDLEGNSVKLSQMLAKGPVMLQFWTSWSGNCKSEMKVLNVLYDKYKDSGFAYIAISIDDQKSVSKVKPYIKSKGYKFTVVYDTDKNVFKTFGGQDPPYSVLLSKEGEILRTYYGFLAGDESKFEDDIKNALGDIKRKK